MFDGSLAIAAFRQQELVRVQIKSFERKAVVYKREHDFEPDTSPKRRAERIVAKVQLLDGTLKIPRLKFYDNPGDGDCFFYTVADWVLLLDQKPGGAAQNPVVRRCPLRARGPFGDGATDGSRKQLMKEVRESVADILEDLWPVYEGDEDIPFKFNEVRHRVRRTACAARSSSQGGMLRKIMTRLSGTLIFRFKPMWLGTVKKTGR